MEAFINTLPIEIRKYICDMVIERDKYVENRKTFLEKTLKLPNRKLKNTYTRCMYLKNKIDANFFFINDPRSREFISKELIENKSEAVNIQKSKKKKSNGIKKNNNKKTYYKKQSKKHVKRVRLKPLDVVPFNFK